MGKKKKIKMEHIQQLIYTIYYHDFNRLNLIARKPMISKVVTVIQDSWN